MKPHTKLKSPANTKKLSGMIYGIGGFIAIEVFTLIPNLFKILVG